MNFDLFVSYAHADNDEAWIDTFVAGLSSTYRKLTGTVPSVFVDRETLITSDIWDAGIRNALGKSTLMLAVISPSYVKSPWCRREWDLFAAREEQMRMAGELPDEQGLIFPILLYPLDRGRFDTAEKAFANCVKRRQWLDVSSQIEGTPIRPQQLRELAEALLDTEVETKIRQRSSSNHLLRKTVSSTIRDSRTMLEWAAELSPAEMSIDEAISYVKELDQMGGGPWRLPTMQELQSLIDPDALDEDPKASPFPLKPPFNVQRFGYLHSSTYIDPARKPDGNFVMNVRNGHLFNGHGYSCFVRAVREVMEP